MISIETRKEIYIRYFLKLHSIRKISRELEVSRSTISKIINEYRVALKNLGLTEEADLYEFIDLVVVKPQRKKRIVNRYKVTQEHIDNIKKLVYENEKSRTLGRKTKTTLELLEEFQDRFCNSNRIFSHNTFYNIVRDIKKKYMY